MMQKDYYKTLDAYEDLEAHKAVVLNGVEQKERGLVEKAIAIVEKYHDTPRTLYPGNYNRHPIRVARILIEEFGVKNTRAILIALCHDLGEWSTYGIENLEGEFGRDVLTAVETLTWDSGSTWDVFFKKIVSTGNKNLMLVKMADKLDNNRGTVFSNGQRQKQKAKQKTELIRPFVQQNFPEYWAKFEESLRVL